MVRLCTPGVPAAGLRDGAHYWRVRAVNGSDAVAGREVGDWSEGWAFTFPKAATAAVACTSCLTDDPMSPGDISGIADLSQLSGRERPGGGATVPFRLGALASNGCGCPKVEEVKNAKQI